MDLQASRTTICARLTWCFWFQDLAKGRHVTDPTPALRAASARFWRVVVCVPLLAWAVLTYGNFDMVLAHFSHISQQ